MKSKAAQYLNEIVSIAILLLMTAALIAAQATDVEHSGDALGRAEFGAIVSIAD